LSKEHTVSQKSASQNPAASRTRIFGKEIQNLKPNEMTPVKKAARVNGDLTPKVLRKTVRVLESFSAKPQHVLEQQKDILTHLKFKEASYAVEREYMSRQKDINSKMRAILVDWLVDVNLKFKLLPQTLFMTVNIIDRYLAAREIARTQLQLVGASALMIAAKFEEIYPPMLKDFVAVCDYAYGKNEILSMESKILHAVNFDICHTSTYAYLKFFNSRLQLEDRLFVFARYLLENSLLDMGSLKHSNSLLAAGAIFLVNKIFKKDCWSDASVETTGYSEEEVKLAARDLYVFIQKAEGRDLCAIKRKFADEAYFEVSKYKIEKAQNKN
jgi:hypothetical protein